MSKGGRAWTLGPYEEGDLLVSMSNGGRAGMLRRYEEGD